MGAIKNRSNTWYVHHADICYGGKDSLIDSFAEREYGAEQCVMEWDLIMRVRLLLMVLTPREAEVIQMRFGINRREHCSLEEVGKWFDVTRERIRQIEARALRKLRVRGLLLGLDELL